MSNINEFPIDKSLKELITNLVANFMERCGIEMNKETKKHFLNECAGELVEEVLETITQWEKQKLN